MTSTAIIVEHLAKEYRIGQKRRIDTSFREAVTEGLASSFRRFRRSEDREDTTGRFWALRDINFEIETGQVVGIIGRNGAGKSTLLKILSRITEPTEGRARIYGRVGSLLEVGTGFHRELTGRENIFLNGAILGMRKTEIDRKFDQIVAFAEIDRFIDTPVKFYSSGMYVRLAFAVAAHLDTEVLFVDEVLAVGDMAFQRKCLGKMGDVVRQGRTILFVSHNMAAIQQLCSRAVLLDGGRIEMVDRVDAVVDAYVASNTRGKQRTGDVLARGAQGDVDLLSVYLVDEQGRPQSAVQCGRDLWLAILLRVSRAIPQAAVSVGINNMYDLRVTVLHSGIAGHTVALREGENRVICRVPRFPLLTGTYSMDIGVLHGMEHLLFAPSVEQLRVEDGDFFDTGRLPDPGWGGFCHLDQEWQVQM